MSVVVYGSANVDLVVTVDRHPAPGETVAALGAVRRQAGGKGLNQAIGSRRAGGHPTAFIGAVGADAEAELVRQTLQQAGVEAVLRRSATLATGFAIVTVDRSAENEIVVVAGANAALDGVTSAEASLLKSANVAVFQGETPQAGFRAAASIARGVGARILLNPSPVWALTDEEIALVDLLVVNETEARLVADQLGIAAGQIGVEAVWCALGSRFPAVVLTRGSRGALWGAGGGPPALMV